MQPQTMGRILVLATLGLALGHIAWYYPQLPERVASHFGPDGQADGWMPKSVFMATYAGLISFTSFLLMGIADWMRRLPNEMINLPYKEFWLAPERREATLNELGEQLSWVGVATNCLLISVMHLTFLANLDGSQRLDSMGLVLVLGYMAFVTIWTIKLMLRYSSVGR